MIIFLDIQTYFVEKQFLNSFSWIKEVSSNSKNFKITFNSAAIYVHIEKGQWFTD